MQTAAEPGLRWSPWARPARQTLTQAPRRWLRPQAATGSSATDASWAATPAAAIPAVTTEGASAVPAVQSLDQVGEATSPTAVTERSASPEETTTSGKRPVTLAPAAYVSTVRRGGAFPRRVQGNSKHARTSAAASYVFGAIFRSLCHAVRLLPSSPMDIARIQRWIFDRVKLRTSAATRQLCTCPADATTAQTSRTTSTGASLGIRVELLIRALPGSTDTLRASRRVSEFVFK